MLSVRTVAIINQKGGCGKTTVAINLAAVLAHGNHRTLLIDLDPQSHCALGLSVPEQQVHRQIGDLLRAGYDGSLGFEDVIWQISRRLDLAPSTMALAGLEQELSLAPDKDRRLVQVLAAVRDRYDFCIIDCPPSIGLLTFNALRAADEVIIPVETGYFALRGSIKQKATIEMLARRAGHDVRFEVLPTMYDVRTKLAREILGELKKHFGSHLLPVVVHFNSKLKEAASVGQAISEYDPSSRGHQDFEDLAQWLIANPPLRPAPLPAAGALTVEAPTNPALSRAAELVERARQLSQRTAALSARLQSERELPPLQRPAVVHAMDVLGDPAAAHPEDPYAEVDEAGTSPDNEGLTASRTGEAATHTPRDEGRGSVLQIARPQPAEQASPATAAQVERVFGVRPTRKGLLFVQPINGIRQMHIAGEFNEWSVTQHPMARNEQLGVWHAVLPINPGRYRYRLVADGVWMRDPYNIESEMNPYGELDSVVEVRSA